MEWMLSVYSVLLSCTLVWFLVLRRKNLRLQRQFELANLLLSNIKPSVSLEKNLDEILVHLSKLYRAKGYGFYIRDDKNEQYVMKAVRHSYEEELNIGPSYSGLMPYKKEAYLLPASILADKIPGQVEVIKEGGVPLLMVPVKDGKAVICIGPVTKVPPKIIRNFRSISQKMEPVIEVLLETENLKKQVKVVVASRQAMKQIACLVMEEDNILQGLLGISINTINAKGGLILEKTAEGILIPVIIGMDQDVEELLRKDTESQELLFDLLGDERLVELHKGGWQFFKLPSYFVANNMVTLIILNLSVGDREGIAVFWYDNITALDALGDHRVAGLKIMLSRIWDIIHSQERVKQLSSSYLYTLKSLAELMDNFNPNTVGYSELMYRFAIIIAKAMNFDNQKVRDIAMAAYLSNIGILGLSKGLVLKEGRYSELEYEMMKLHAEVGATIIETTTGNKNIASYIRSHHERFDGMGYPEGLKGHDIPVGSRIIGVIQTFLAKINGRKGREALDFYKALDLLKAASGSQLDPEIVNILVSWFQNKQLLPEIKEKSLGPCWQMRCAPEEVCKVCPAYDQTEINCWEFSGVNCHNHGNECSSCFVRTEFIGRRGNTA